MNGAFYIGAIGLEAQQHALDTIANNISNVNTTGFKRSEMRFAEIVASRTDPEIAAALPSGSPEMAGVMASPMFMINQAGRVQTTGNRSDLAIDGDGFIEVMGPNGEALLWRGGTLQVGDDGLLATAQGYPLKAAVSVPIDAGTVEIGPDGSVRTTTSEQSDAVEIGQINLVRAPATAVLDRLDGGYYQTAGDVAFTEAAPGQDGTGRLVQGALEQSNVELTTEMVQLMMVQRAYAANAQIVQAADQLMALANGLRR